MIAWLLAAAAVLPPPADAPFDYQLGGAYPPPAGVTVVVRDATMGPVPEGAYGVCYVNAFQTQPGQAGRWPRGLVLRRLGDDPGWPGEYAVDISTAARRARAAAFVGRTLERCAALGHRAAELDNLDSWTRFRDAPFGRADAVAYARLLARRAHALDLAVGQKNASQLTRREVARAGFDFAVAEECARYRECGRYLALHGDRVLAVEYRRRDFTRACRTIGGRVAVVLRDLAVSRPGARSYRFDTC